jgi:hypothetical protein
MKTNVNIHEVLAPPEKNMVVLNSKKNKSKTDQATRYFKALIEIEFMTLKI